MQVKAGNILPANFLIQGLLISALFEPFGALCSVASAEITQVTEVALDMALFEVSMVLIYDECDPRKVWPFPQAHPALVLACLSTLLMPPDVLQTVPKALQNATFMDFCKANGLALEQAELASVSLAPGDNRPILPGPEQIRTPNNFLTVLGLCRPFHIGTGRFAGIS